MPVSKETIYLREHELKEAVLLSTEQAIILRSQFSKRLTIQRSWADGEKWDIKAKQYVGIIELENLRIVIEPKTAVQNLFFMLTYAYDLPEFRTEKTKLSHANDLFEYIADMFINLVEQLARQGIYRSYQDFEENQPYLRGRLLLHQHLTINAVSVDQLYQRINEFTADIPENRILKYTLWLLSHLDFQKSNLRQRARRAETAFGEARFETIQPWHCDEIIYTRLNQAYKSPIHLAKLLIQHLSLEGQIGKTPFVSYLLDMNRIFELFIANYLREYFEQNHSDFEVEIQPQIWLDNENKDEGLPDIILKYAGHRHMVLDTKHKLEDGHPSTHDRNQMYIYCDTLGITLGCLIYSRKPSSRWKRTYQDVELYASGLSLDGNLSEFQANCQLFAEQFVQMIELETTVSLP